MLHVMKSDVRCVEYALRMNTLYLLLSILATVVCSFNLCCHHNGCCNTIVFNVACLCYSIIHRENSRLNEMLAEAFRRKYGDTTSPAGVNVSVLCKYCINIMVENI